MSASVSFWQMITIMLLVLAGYACSKTHVVKKGETGVLSRLMADVLNPAIIVSSMLGKEDMDKGSVLAAFPVGALMFFLSILLGMVLCRFLSGQKTERKVYQLMLVFTNLGFIGIPLVRGLFGEGALVYVAVYILEYNILIYTYGYALLSGAGKDGEKPEHPVRDMLKSLCNMGTLACIAGLVIFLGGVQLPQVLSSAITYLGDAAVPLSLLIVGMNMADQNLKAILTEKKSYLFLAVKMILVPLILMLVLKVLPIDAELAEISMILMAMPVGTMPLVMINAQEIDAPFCSADIVLTTIFSVLTIPLMIWIYSVIG